MGPGAVARPLRAERIPPTSFPFPPMETLSAFLGRIRSRVHATIGNESLAFIPDEHRAAAFDLSDHVVTGSYSAMQLGFMKRDFRPAPTAEVTDLSQYA